MALPALAAGVVALALSFDTPDDAFISFRYAENLAAGRGLVFNADEHVEGFSNPSWTLLCAGLRLLGLPMVATAKALGILCAVATILALGTALRSLFPAHHPVVVLVPCTFLALSPFPGFWAATGMETPLAALLLLLALRSWLVEALDGRQAATGVFVGLLCLTRPEAPMFWMLALAGFLLLRRPDAALRLSIGTVLVFVPWFVFRLSYYGLPLPNSAYAKRTTSTAVYVDQGLEYLSFFRQVSGIGSWILLLLLAGAAAASFLSPSRRVRLSLRAALAAIGLQVLFVLLVGGDWMEGFRFLVPVYPIVAVALGSLLAAVTGGARQPWLAGGCALVLALVTDVAACRGFLARISPARQELFAFDTEGPWRATIAALSRRIPAGSLVAAHEIGNLGFRGIDWRILDIWGLTDRHIASSPENVGVLHGSTGDAEYVMARAPAFIVAWQLESADGAPYVHCAVEEIQATRAFRTWYDEAGRYPEPEPEPGRRRHVTVVWKRRDEPRGIEPTLHVLDLGDPAAATHLVAGFYRFGDGVRWVKEEAAFVLAPVPAADQVLVLEAGVFLGLCADGEKTLTLTALVNGTPIGSRTFDQDFAGEVRFGVPRELLAGSAVAEVVLRSSKACRQPENPRKRAYALRTVGLHPSG